MFSGSWALKRVYKFVLKRVLGKLLKNEINLEQLEVQLGAGTINLRNLQLNEDYLNQQLAAGGLSVSSGYVGSVTVTIPWKGLCSQGCEIELDEVEMILTPSRKNSTGLLDTCRPGHSLEHPAVEGLQYGSSEAESARPGDHYGIGDGVRKIARMVEGILLGLHARLTNISLQFEDESQPGAVVVSIPVLEYRDETSLARDESGLAGVGVEASLAPALSPAAEPEVVKMVAVEGVTVQVCPDRSRGAQVAFSGEGGGGVEGSVRVAMRWREGHIDLPKLDVECVVGSVLLQVTPKEAGCVAALLQAFAQAKSLQSQSGLGSSGVPGLAQQERALHELAGSWTINRPTAGTPAYSPTNFQTPKAPQTLEDLLMSRHMGPPPGGEHVRSPRGGALSALDQHLISDWALDSTGVHDSKAEAALDSSVEEFFECVEGVASGLSSGSGSALLAWARASWQLPIRVSHLHGSAPTNQAPRQHSTGGNCTARVEVSSIRVLLMVEREGSSSLPEEDQSGYLELLCQKASLSTLATATSGFELSLGSLEVAELAPLSAARPGERTSEAVEALVAKAESALPQKAPPQQSSPRGSPGQRVNGSPSCSPMQHATVHMRHQWQHQVQRCPWAAPSGLQRKRLLRTLTPPGHLSPPTAPLLRLVATTPQQPTASAGGLDVAVEVQPLAAVLEVASQERLTATLTQLAAAMQEALNSRPAVAANDASDSSLGGILGDLERHRFQRSTSLGCGLDPDTFATPRPTGCCIRVSGAHHRVLLLPPQLDDTPAGVLDVIAVDVVGEAEASSGVPLVKVEWGVQAGAEESQGQQKKVQTLVQAAAVTAYLVTTFPWKSSPAPPRALLLLTCVGSRRQGEGFQVEVSWQAQSRSGRWLAEAAWSGVYAQQARGDGGSGVGSTPQGEAAAARAAAREEELAALELREKAVATSHLVLRVTLPKVKADLADWQVERLVEILGSSRANGKPETTSPQKGLPSQDATQVSLLVDIRASEVTLRASQHDTTPSGAAWAEFHLALGETILCHVAAAGGCSDASYSWGRIDSCSLHGTLAASPDKSKGAIQCLLFSCADDVIGRGDAGGGNALASPGTAGVTVSAMLWPGGQKDTAAVVTSSIRGCTLLAPGGRLDWLAAIAGVVPLKPSARVDTSSSSEGEEMEEPADGSEAGLQQSVFALLDLHDLAVVYEPKLEAVEVPRYVRFVTPTTNGHRAAPPTATGGGPVAAVLAAAALRASTTLQRSAQDSPYHLWLRDGALLLLDTAFRPPGPATYSAAGLQGAGFVVVAREAVMEALVCPPTAATPWELQCANNQLRLYGRKDSTAALGRLAAQIQELLQANLEQTTLGGQGVLVSTPAVPQGSLQAGPSDGTQGGKSNECRQSDERKGGLSCSLKSGPGINGVLGAVQEGAFLRPRNRSETTASTPKRVWPSEGISQKSIHTTHLNGLFIEDFYQKQNSLPSSSRASSTVFQGGWFECQEPELMESYIGGTKKSRKVDPSPVPPQSGGLQGFSSQLAKRYPRFLARLLLRDVSVRWRLQPGCHWGATSSQGKGEEATALEIFLDGVHLQFDAFPQGGHYASRLELRIRDAAVYDISPTAPWRVVLGYHRSPAKPRESGSHAVRLELDSVRPDPNSILEEYRLLLALLPLRLHLDQRHIDFLGAFFSDPTAASSESPVAVNEKADTAAEGSGEALLPFFQMVELRGFVLCVDYIPRRMDVGALRAGQLAELVNLVAWEGVELTLKPLRATGVHGWAGLGGLLAQEWLQDIADNQVAQFVRGVAPLRPLLEVARGARALVTLPRAAYQRDRRWLRGLRRGAHTFVRALSLEALTLGAGVAGSAAELLQAAEAALADHPRSASSSPPTEPLEQPTGAREGLKQACDNLARGFERSASSLVSGPMKVYQRGAGAGAAVGSALRGAPAAAVAPVAAAAGAMQWALLGVRNEMDPSKKREFDEKHVGPPPEGRRRR